MSFSVHANDMPVTWQTVESHINWLEAFDPSWLPDGLTDHLRVLRRGQTLALEVGGIVGAIPLKNGDTLHVRPKAGPINLFRMLLVVEDLFEESRNHFREFVQYSSGGESTPQLVADSFLIGLAEITARSLRFCRQRVTIRGDFAKGRLHIRDTRVEIARQHPQPVVSESWSRSYDTPENRLLAAAARHALAIASSGLAPPYIENAKKWIAKFPIKSNVHLDLAKVNEGLAKGVFLGSRGYYVRELLLAKILLGEHGLGQEGVTDVFGVGLLINSSHLFESYLRAVLARRYAKDGLIVRKGSSPAAHLYCDGSFRLEPDIVISRGAKPLLIGDAKYKVPQSGDHYQMAVYMRSLNVGYGILLCPADDNLLDVRKFRTFDGGKVFEIRLPLSDLDATERMLGSLHELVPLL
jgi:5-methylcytosine-specific restriction endonuclease McrBC regulatory subunit McrC